MVEDLYNDPSGIIANRPINQAGTSSCGIIHIIHIRQNAVSSVALHG